MLDRLGADRPGPTGLRHFEQSLEAMTSAELSELATLEVIELVDEYVYRFAIREARDRGEKMRGLGPEVRGLFQREIDTGDYPLVRRFVGPDADEAPDRIEAGLSS